MGFVVALGIAGFLVLFSGRASPAIILRMYKAQAIEHGQLPELTQTFDALVRRAQLEQTPKLYYVPSKMMNAFAVGRGDNAAVAITHGLLQHMNLREITGVLAHEISHILHRDLWVMGLADIFSRLTTSMGQIGQLMVLFSIPAILYGMDFPWLAVVVLLIAPMVSGLLQLALSRTREFEADFGAAQITGDPAGLASALRKIDQAHTGWWQKLLLPGRKVPDPALLRSHPPTEDRIERLLAMSGEALPNRFPTAEIPPPVARMKLRGPRWHITGLWY